MSTSLFSFIFTGVLGVGAFAGTLQQNFSHPQKTEYDLLFEEIEKNIREFSERNHITEKDFLEINFVASDNEIKEEQLKGKDGTQKFPNHTLSAWTTIWISLLSGYIEKLWLRNTTGEAKLDSELKNFTDKEKQEALVSAEKNVEKEKKEFEKKLDSAKTEIEKIYQKMKKFLQIMKLPKKYNASDYEYAPYEEYVRKISQ